MLVAQTVMDDLFIAEFGVYWGGQNVAMKTI